MSIAIKSEIREMTLRIMDHGSFKKSKQKYMANKKALGRAKGKINICFLLLVER